ncbi:MAG TPA: late competence development ComFB family protein, partial [Bacillota bacterium]|nr:late competence development ComFB family protein [Bacillota bacterium]
MSYKNYMEDVVLEVYQDFIITTPDFRGCKCSRCKDDVIALALTNLRGRYAVSPEGEVWAKLAKDDRQVRADALVAVIA